VFERFTEGAKAALVAARDLALELGSDSIEVGHLLHGCAEGREETAGRPLRDCGITGAAVRGRLPRRDVEPAAGPIDPEALRSIGIDYDQVRSVVEATFGPGALDTAPDRHAPGGVTRKPAFTVEAKRALELALRVAGELHHERVTPGHLLLGLLRLDDGFVTGSLDDAGTTVAELSSAVLIRLSGSA
jgi:ATP-dependent Clp protease ATP-binding subunit ClpA